MVSEWVGLEGVGWTGQTEHGVGTACHTGQTLSSMSLTVTLNSVGIKSTYMSSHGLNRQPLPKYMISLEGLGFTVNGG